jgi:integrase
MYEGQRDVQKLMRKAGVPVLHIHSLRHSGATFLLMQGVAPRVVIEILGHSEIDLTMKTPTASLSSSCGTVAA